MYISSILLYVLLNLTDRCVDMRFDLLEALLKRGILPNRSGREIPGFEFTDSNVEPGSCYCTPRGDVQAIVVDRFHFGERNGLKLELSVILTS